MGGRNNEKIDLFRFLVAENIYYKKYILILSDVKQFVELSHSENTAALSSAVT